MSYVHRAYCLAHALRQAWWWLRRPTNHGVMVALRCESGTLLVRNSYRAHCWTLPGGSVGKRETLKDAAVREMLEEVAIRIAPDRLREVDIIFHDTEFLKGLKLFPPVHSYFERKLAEHRRTGAGKPELSGLD